MRSGRGRNHPGPTPRRGPDLAGRGAGLLALPPVAGPPVQTTAAVRLHEDGSLPAIPAGAALPADSLPVPALDVSLSPVAERTQLRGSPVAQGAQEEAEALEVGAAHARTVYRAGRA